jgi:hypothetical protein
MPDPQPPLWQDVRWIVATFFAVWGAGLSTYQQVLRRREQRIRIEVIVRNTVAVAAGPRTNHLSIDVRNTGHVDVFFRAVRISFEVEHSQPRLVLNLFTCDTAFPTVLRPGDSFSVLASRDAAFLQQVRMCAPDGPIRLRAEVWDALERRFVSDWVGVEEGR